MSNTRANFETVKNLYNELFNSVGINLHEYFINLGLIEKQTIDTNLTNHNLFTWDPQESYIQQRILTTYRDFYYETGRFPGRNTLIPVPRVPIPSFIDTNDVLSPRDLYESYVGRDMRGLFSLQFLAAFNRFLGGESSLSRNAMGEFLHNLSWQALTNDNDSIQVKFKATTELIKNINYLIQKEIYKNKKKTIEINQNVGGQLNNKVIETHEDVNQETEYEIVRDIINNDDTDYKPINVPPTVKTEDEIDQNNLLWNEDFLKTGLAKIERDFQIIDDINAKYQADLIRKAVDPLDGQLTNEQINQTDFNRIDKNEPLAVPLPSGSLDVLDKFVNKLSDEVNPDIPDQYPTPPPLTQIKPEVVSTPTLQDILTGVVKVEDDALKDLQNVRDEVMRLDFPEQTGIRSVDEQNLDDYYDTLQQIRPGLFIDKDDDVPNFASMPDLEDIPDFPEIRDLNSLMDTPSNVPYLLVPTDVDIGSNDPAEILADPNVTTIILPATEDPNNALLPLSNFNFVPLSDEDDLIPKEMDTDKIILTDDGDVMLIDPDNMQKDEKPFKFVSEDVVELPSEEEDMEVVRTKNIVLKRKKQTMRLHQLKNKNLILRLL